MKMKIYSKKSFLSGMVFLLLAAIGIPLTIIHFPEYNTLRIVKSVITDVFCLLVGITGIYRSLNKNCSMEDDQNDDEREKLINIKAKSSAYNITFLICVIIIFLSILAFVKTKNNAWLGILIGIGIVPTVMIIAEIGCYVYHDSRN